MNEPIHLVQFSHGILVESSDASSHVTVAHDAAEPDVEELVNPFSSSDEQESDPADEHDSE